MFQKGELSKAGCSKSRKPSSTSKGKKRPHKESERIPRVNLYRGEEIFLHSGGHFIAGENLGIQKKKKKKKKESKEQAAILEKLQKGNVFRRVSTLIM